MELNVSKSVADAVGALLPWDLTLVLQGVPYRVRPLLMADLASLAELENAKDLSSLKKIEALFEDPKPDLDKASVEEVTVCAMAIMLYFRDRAEKNSRAIAARVPAAMETASTARS